MFILLLFLLPSEKMPCWRNWLHALIRYVRVTIDIIVSTRKQPPTYYMQKAYRVDVYQPQSCHPSNMFCHSQYILNVLELYLLPTSIYYFLILWGCRKNKFRICCTFSAFAKGFYHVLHSATDVRAKYKQSLIFILHTYKYMFKYMDHIGNRNFT